jgi:hypothetical protein
LLYYGLSNKESSMAYKVLEVDNMREKYGARPGLEGPFNFSGRVLYYDNKEGSYYDPRTDFYVSQSEMDALNQQFYEILKR